MWEFLLPYIEVSIPISLLIAGLIVSKSLLNKNYLVKTRYYIWLIIALRLLIPFDLPNFSKVEKPVQIDIENVIIYTASPVAGSENTGTNNIRNNVTQNNIVSPDDNSFQPPSASISSPKKSIRLADVAVILWPGGCAALIIYYILQFILVNRHFRKSSRLDYDCSLKLKHMTSEFGIKNKLKVYRCSCVTSPVIVGIFRPRIYIPDFDISDDLLEMMLRHELIHYKRNDIAYKLLILAACCVHWFNPFVWLMNKQAARDIEISCDEDVIRGQDKQFRRMYSDSIMSIIKKGKYRKTALSTGFADDKSTLVTRFKNIYDTRIKKLNRLAILFILSLSVISSTFVALKSQRIEVVKDVPRQAMDFMEIYSSGTMKDDFFTNENFHIGFCWLLRENLVDKYRTKHTDGSPSGYKLSVEQSMDLYQFIMADKMPDSWWTDIRVINPVSYASDYNIYHPYLSVQSVDYIDENTFTATFDRYYDNYLYDNVTFVMEKQTVDTVPADISHLYTPGEEIWRIKSVSVQQLDIVATPFTVEIDNKEQFMDFINDMNTNAYRLKNNTYKLTADIDLEGAEIPVIGTMPDKHIERYHFVEYGGFTAKFDGQGHSISNFVIEYDGTYKYPGLFGYVGPDSEIRNLNVINGTVRPTDDRAAKATASAGLLTGSNNGIIYNCSVSGSVTGFREVGGMIGYLGGGAYDCISDVQVNGCGELGGFAGCVNSMVENCESYGTVTAYADPLKTEDDVATPHIVGGFAGGIIDANVTACHSETRLNIMSTARMVGAFSGTCEGRIISMCTYNPAIAGSWETADYIGSTTVIPPDVTAIN